MRNEIDPERVVVTELVPGSEYPIHLMYVELLDGVYAPIGLRKTDGAGPHPTVLLGRRNGGGMAWVREATRNMGYIQERLREAGNTPSMRPRRRRSGSASPIWANT